MFPFTIKQDGIEASVTQQMDGNKRLYRFEWEDDTMDWIYWDEKVEVWKSETVIPGKQLRELGRKVSEKLGFNVLL